MIVATETRKRLCHSLMKISSFCYCKKNMVMMIKKLGRHDVVLASPIYYAVFVFLVIGWDYFYVDPY